MRVLAIGFAVTALWLAACDFRGGDTAPPAAPTDNAEGDDAGSAEDALRVYVERRLRQGFVAECDDARRPEDVGKQCAHFRGERGGNLRAYELGPTFSEYTRLIILEQLDGVWTIAHLENRDPSLPAAPGVPWPLAVGERVVVAGTNDCLRVREAPDADAYEITCLADGTRVTITDGPREADRLQWWQLDRIGWSASNWLRYPEEAPEAAPTAGDQ